MTKRNPWIGALWGIGIVLVVAAFVGQMWLSSFYFQMPNHAGSGPIIAVIQQLVDPTIIPAFSVGFGTIGGLFFLHARNHACKPKRKPSA